ncbi:MAG: hypothetical protein WDO69_28505 [Pseudomonadota bacterium]
MSFSRKLRAGLALGAVLASCQLAGCSDSNDGGGGDSDGGGDSGANNAAGRAGSAQAGRAGMTGRAGSGHAGEDDMNGMAGEPEVGGGNEAGGMSGTAGSGVGGMSGGGTGGASAGTGGAHAGGAGGAGGAGAGAGGASAGAGGAHAGTGGTGGASAGTGGAGAGSGGVSAGTGGVSAGSGGVSAGTGGSSAGTGGAHAGTGGASAGTGGASAGTGGASGGSGGAATAVCGNNIVEAGEVCDPKLTANNCGRDCKAITSPDCLACEVANAQYGFDQTFITCNTAIGNTTTATVTGSTGAAKPTDPNPVTTPVGTSKAMLCNEVLDCVRDTHCAAGGVPTLSACYCGTVSQADCSNGLGNGLCKAEIDRSLEAQNFSTVVQHAGQTFYGGGVAMSRVDSDQSYCDSTCLPLN